MTKGNQAGISLVMPMTKGVTSVVDSSWHSRKWSWPLSPHEAKLSSPYARAKEEEEEVSWVEEVTGSLVAVRIPWCLRPAHDHLATLGKIDHGLGQGRDQSPQSCHGLDHGRKGLQSFALFLFFLLSLSKRG